MIVRCPCGCVQLTLNTEPPPTYRTTVYHTTTHPTPKNTIALIFSIRSVLNLDKNSP